MKKIIVLSSMFACLLLLNACKKGYEDLPVNTIESIDQSVQPDSNRLALSGIGLNSDYEDDYPEWGIYGTNWPAPGIFETYSPRPDMYLAVQIDNSVRGLLGGTGYTATPYIHIQWRKLYEDWVPASRWYTYHPDMREYTPLRIDTIQNWSPNDYYWEHHLNAKALPKGNIELRTRLLMNPLDPDDRASATLWGRYDSRIYNYYGYTDDGSGPGEGQQVDVRLSIDLDVSINNLPGYKIDYVLVKAFGNTYNYNRTSSSMISRGEVTTKVRLNEPTPYSYTATVEAYGGSTKLASGSATFTNMIYVSTSTGSSPYFQFKDYYTLNIY